MNVCLDAYSLTFTDVKALYELEYLAVYGRASMSVPVGVLQSTVAPTTDYYLSHLYGDWASDTFFFVTYRNVST